MLFHIKMWRQLSLILSSFFPIRYSAKSRSPQNCNFTVTLTCHSLTASSYFTMERIKRNFGHPVIIALFTFSLNLCTTSAFAIATQICSSLLVTAGPFLEALWSTLTMHK